MKTKSKDVNARALSYSIPLFALAAILLLTSACKDKGTTNHSDEKFAFDAQIPNEVLAITGDSTGIPGVQQDPNTIRNLFENHMGFHVDVVPNASVATIRSASQTIAQRMTASPNSTLIWYFSGHGTDNGQLMGVDGGFYFNDIANAMLQARGNIGFKRLVVFLDACYSGQTATSLSPIPSLQQNFLNPFTQNNGNFVSQQFMSNQIVNNASGLQGVTGTQGKLFEELIIITSSRPNQPSGDTDRGGLATLAFAEALQRLQATQPNARVRDLGPAMESLLAGSGQNPMTKVYPDPLVWTAPLFRGSVR